MGPAALINTIKVLATFTSPQAIATDSEGNVIVYESAVARDSATGDVYVSSPNDELVRRIDPDGVVTTLFAVDEGVSGIAFDAGKLYVNQRGSPNPRVYEATTGDLLREVDVTRGGCEGRVAPPHGGLAVSNRVLYIACGDRLVSVDIDATDAVRFISNDRIIDGVHASSGDGVYLASGRHVAHYSDAGELTNVFASPLPTDVAAILRTDRTPASMFILQLGPAPSSACAAGGLRLDVGNDRTDASVWYYVSTEDGALRRVGHVIDGILDADEIKSTTYSCNRPTEEQPATEDHSPSFDANAPDAVVRDTQVLEPTDEGKDPAGIDDSLANLDAMAEPAQSEAGGCAAAAKDSTLVVGVAALFLRRRRRSPCISD